ncbi:hypothetical protein CMUS01_03078 [Colletotrichum musicola]|uniref:Uncharacterized protein n=1 Tax=Colletotrichum musicola TaxID=2175873 RepID=A0A8H6NTU8_9PEZI|nr:hypothetical protein CMUS01_03078 [Colletotrichum musicola]
MLAWGWFGRPESIEGKRDEQQRSSDSSQEATRNPHRRWHSRVRAKRTKLDALFDGDDDLVHVPATAVRVFVRRQLPQTEEDWSKGKLRRWQGTRATRLRAPHELQAARSVDGGRGEHGRSAGGRAGSSKGRRQAECYVWLGVPHPLMLLVGTTLRHIASLHRADGKSWDSLGASRHQGCVFM